MPQVDYDALIAKIPDFPKPGVTFQDITTLLKDPKGFGAVIDDLAGHFADAGVTKGVGAEAAMYPSVTSRRRGLNAAPEGGQTIAEGIAVKQAS